MFERLKTKWQVNGIRLILILCTFAIGGSLCGYLGKEIMSYIPLENRFFQVVLYVIIVTLLWPLCVLLISIPFGQWKFFVRYLGRMGQRIRGRSGSKAQNQR